MESEIVEAIKEVSNVIGIVGVGITTMLLFTIIFRK